MATHGDAVPNNEALRKACIGGDDDEVGRLLAVEGVEVHTRDADGQTPLFWACRYGHASLVQQLLAVEGIDVNKGDSYGCTPLHAACSNGHAAVVARLLAVEGIDANKRDVYWRTPLFRICCRSLDRAAQMSVVQQLLAVEGIEVNKGDSADRTPLHMACSNGHAAGVARLLAVEGIDVNTPSTKGHTPLSVACQLYSPDVAVLLLNAKADPADRSLNGLGDDPSFGTFSRLLWTARHHRKRLLAGLVRHYAQIASKTERDAQVGAARVMRRLPLVLFRDVASLLLGE